MFESEQTEQTEWSDTLWCLFKHGPTFDGDVPSKSERDELVEQGLAERFDGFQWLTLDGVKEAIRLKMDQRKEKEARA